ncbi:MAG: hypothetical protein B6D53_04045 [Candidatus Omnitrophica bacterium 4484_49]|nr:MAG: hypothetical protein B6D53_04045 [Candidatus Omnitrophica bacterium 4484_49]
MHLTGNLKAISNPVIIGTALVMYVIEFVVDKVSDFIYSMDLKKMFKFIKAIFKILGGKNCKIEKNQKSGGENG